MKRSPLQAIRAFCKECQGGLLPEVTACQDAGCSFFPYREGLALPKGAHKPTKAIKTYCHEGCQAGEGRAEVKGCQGNKATLGACPVFPFRLGVNPNRKRGKKPVSRPKKSQESGESTLG